MEQGKSSGAQCHMRSRGIRYAFVADRVLEAGGLFFFACDCDGRLCWLLAVAVAVAVVVVLCERQDHIITGSRLFWPMVFMPLSPLLPVPFLCLTFRLDQASRSRSPYLSPVGKHNSRLVAKAFCCRSRSTPSRLLLIKFVVQLS